MLRIPFQFLPTFVAVADCESLRTASRVLHLTHSAVSQQISELESRLGFPLFERRKGRLILTAAGQLMLESSRRALADIEGGVRQATAASRRAEYTLKITMPVAFAQRWFLPRVARWYQAHPDIHVEVDASPQVRDLYRDGFHGAIRSNEGPWPGMTWHPLYEAPSRFVAVASPVMAERLLAGSPSALLEERLLGARDEWADWFELAGVTGTPQPSAAFNRLTLLLNAAEEGLGVCMAREILVVDALCSGALQQVFDIVSVRPDVPPHGLVYATELDDSTPIAIFRDWLRLEAAESLSSLRDGPTERQDDDA